MKYKLLIVALLGLGLTACTSSMPSMGSTPAPVYQAPTPEKSAKFNPIMTEVALSTREDPNYHRMALNTQEEKKWFKMLMYRLWDRQITKSQFIAEGVARYPTHRYEFNFIADGFQKRS